MAKHQPLHRPEPDPKRPTPAQMRVLRLSKTGARYLHRHIMNAWEHRSAEGRRTRLIAPVMARLVAAGWLQRTPISEDEPGYGLGTVHVYTISSAGIAVLAAEPTTKETP